MHELPKFLLFLLATTSDGRPQPNLTCEQVHNYSHRMGPEWRKCAASREPPVG
ncbi:unnamed protein product [Amoebophrya sp. A25]|nr:unnamed protein product [Amoebophrya sp. A25]|eukprot:GSA25T00016273001.1